MSRGMQELLEHEDPNYFTAENIERLKELEELEKKSCRRGFLREVEA